MDGSISIEGLDKVTRALGRADKAVREAAMRGLQRAALTVVADAQDNLRKNGSVVTGLLRQSGRVQKVDELNVDAGFFDTRNQEGGYALFVEYGRRAGKMPPPETLEAYCYKKFQLRDWKAARAMGWAMAVKIAREGTKPHPFLAPALDKNRRRIVQTVQDAINKATQ